MIYEYIIYLNYKKLIMFCSNCNKSNHEYKDCKEPITSWGIILVNLSNLSNLKNTIKHENNINIRNRISNISPQNYKDLEYLSKYMNDIKFLLIQRRHSIAYMDFLRGKYKIDNIDQINSLFQYMNPLEIKVLKEKDFIDLWKEMWNNDPIKINNTKEYNNCLNKFMLLKNSTDLDLNLDFFINNVTPLYKTNEWGFPKGRKNHNESPIDCAIREFGEETGIDISKINVIRNIAPIEENLTGTNGLPYRHIYYIAETTLQNIHNVENNNEIGNIGFFNYNDAKDLIRDYHVDKKYVLQCIYMYYLEMLLEIHE
jgi:8-oxo-dGTP pyrophosphatase MutT (NUDIX family)